MMRSLIVQYAKDAPGAQDFHKLIHRLDNCRVMVNHDEQFFYSRSFCFEMQLIAEQIGYARSPYRQGKDIITPPPKIRRKPVYPDVPSDPFWSSVSKAVFDDDHMITGTEKTDDRGCLEYTLSHP